MHRMVWSALVGVGSVMIVAAGIGVGNDVLERFNSAPGISYGTPGSVYLKLKRDDPKPVNPLILPQAGGSVFICFDDLTWLRPIGYTLTIWFLDANGRRDDFDDRLVVHRIYPSEKMGPFPKKCRAWDMPAGLDPGPHIMTGLAVPTDSSSRAAPVSFPRIPFVVK